MPPRFAGYSAATGSVSDAPPGRAIALYQQGSEPARDIVLSADRDAYRELDLAGTQPTGTPAPALLSPDGSRVAVGSYRAKTPEVSIQDLVTGARTSHPAGADGVGTVPMAWSPAGDRIALVVTTGADGPVDGHLAGDVVVLDLRTSRATTVLAGADLAAAAFAPGGTELAVQDRSGRALRIVGPDGTTRRELALPPGTGLTGPAAWSPDGRLIAVAPANAGCPDQHGLITLSDWCLGERIEFLDASASGRAVPAPVTAGGRQQLVGWRAPDRVLVFQDEGTGDPVLTDVPLGGTPHRLSVLPVERGNHPVGALQLATGLLADLQVRAPGATDRGRWPIHWRLGTAAGVAALAWAAIAAGSWALRRRRRAAPRRVAVSGPR